MQDLFTVTVLTTAQPCHPIVHKRDKNAQIPTKLLTLNQVCKSFKFETVDWGLTYILNKIGIHTCGNDTWLCQSLYICKNVLVSVSSVFCWTAFESLILSLLKPVWKKNNSLVFAIFYFYFFEFLSEIFFFLSSLGLNYCLWF